MKRPASHLLTPNTNPLFFYPVITASFVKRNTNHPAGAMLLIKNIYTQLKAAQREERLLSEPTESHPEDRHNKGFYPGGEKEFYYFLRRGRPHGTGYVWYPDGTLKHEYNWHKG